MESKKDRAKDSSHCSSHRDSHHHQHPGKSSESMLDKCNILSALTIRPGQTILDAGCGNGYMAKAFDGVMQHQGKVYAIDPHEASIRQLREETAGTCIEPMVADITAKTCLPDAAADLIYLALVFHGFQPPQIAPFLAEVKRLLKPNGCLAIVEIQKIETPFGPPQELRYSPEELNQVIDLQAVKIIEVGPYFYLSLFRR